MVKFRGASRFLFKSFDLSWDPGPLITFGSFECFVFSLD